MSETGNIGPRKPPKRAAPPHVPEIIERAAVWPRFVVRRGADLFWVRDMHAPQMSISRTYAVREDAQVVADWLTERAAGYPRNQAMDLWPTNDGGWQRRTCV